MILFLGLVLGFVVMEWVAYASHRWIMHGSMWFLHRSHHQKRTGLFEANDWFGVAFSLISIGLIWFGKNGHPFVMGLGFGLAVYGLGYLLMHDLLTHCRFGRVLIPRNAYLQRLVKAHRIHHSRDVQDGKRNFGFLWPPSLDKK